MEAYEFYWLEPKGGYEIIGVLPERRKKPERITNESILNWGKKYFGNSVNLYEMFVLKVIIDGKTIRR